MIRYALECAAGHGFESWFRDSAAFDAQANARLLACPACGTAEVAKVIMAPAVVAGRRPPAPARQAMAMPGPDDPAMRAMLRAFRAHVEANAEHVGAEFPEEARRIHYGEADARAIYGEASLEEARALNEEGIEVMPVPAIPDDRH